MSDLNMQDLKISLVQFNPVWENPSANREHLEELLFDLQTDLIVLPEMFSTGFSMNVASLAETMDGPTLHWMVDLAQELNCSICGSLIVKETTNIPNSQEQKTLYYNRLVWANPFGALQYYDKAHLFRMGLEHIIYTPGTQRKLMLVKGWSICPLICYDLRFPVWSRNFTFPNNNEYDLLIYIASWPAARSFHWSQLLLARAIENLAFVAGVNRIGEDGNGLNYNGSSALIDYKGGIIESLSDEEKIVSHVLSKNDLLTYRKSFPAWRDADSFDWKSPL